jgi:DNA-directed RNA polymerase specialized sigma24 family protein
MFVDERATRDSLARMIRRLTANLALREDLLQEALVHIWLTEVGRPSQTKSWYLQSCKYHLLHYLASGRSVDSAKRRNNQLEWERDSYDLDGMVDENKADNSVFAWVSARDIVSLLSSQLSGQEKAVLDCFAEGLGPREIGRKLRMSHTMVIKHRRKIATLFNRLDPPISLHAGISPNGNSGNNGNGNAHGLKTNGFNRSLRE